MGSTSITTKEWAGVTVVGLALGYAISRLTMGDDPPPKVVRAATIAMATTYVIGVGVGASRPEHGWF